MGARASVGAGRSLRSSVSAGAPPPLLPGRPFRAATYNVPLSSNRRARISWNGESSRTNAFPSASIRSTFPGVPVPASRLPALSKARAGACVGSRVGLVERHPCAVRCDLVDDPLVAGGSEQVALRVDRQRPDVLVFGAEKRRRGAVAVDLVDAAVGRRADVDPTVRRG